MEVEEESNVGENVAVAAPALIAVHPREKSIAVAVGSELRVFDLEGDRPINLVDDTGGPIHFDAIRVISFGAEGRLFVSAGDDKLVKIWATDTWSCVRTVCSEKRVSAAAITHDGVFVTFADKFGVVWIVGLEGCRDSQALIKMNPVPILGHYCSIITSLKFSPDGRFIASSDRDFKIRITVFPKLPLKGVHEIQSYCLGHRNFVTCLAFVCPFDHPTGLLLSGGGDSTICLWDHISGHLLHTCEFRDKISFLGSNEASGENFVVVNDICASSEGSVIVVAIQGLHGIMLMNCDFTAKTLTISKIVEMEEGYIPTNLSFSSSPKRIWTVSGGSNPSSTGISAGPLVRLRVVSNTPNNNEIVLEDEQVPGRDKLLLKLQGTLRAVEKEGEALAATAWAVSAAMRNLFTKKQYSVENRERRKRARNDRKLKK